MLHRRFAAEWWRVATAATLLVGAASFSTLLKPLDNQLYDWTISARRTAPSSDIVLVEIDPASLNELGRWPWPRDIHAQFLERLAPVRPRAVGYDVLFLEPESGDRRLSEALRGVGKVVLPSLPVDARGDVLGPSRLQPLAGDLERSVAAVGTAELTLDMDGRIRRACRRGSEPGAPAPMIGLLARQASAAGQEGPRCFLIDYVPSDHFLRISFAALLKGRVPADALRDRIVLVGLTAEGLGDLHAVPGTAGGLLSGIEVQANALNTLLQSSDGQAAPAWVTFLASLVPLSLFLFSLRSLRTRRNLVIFAAIAGVYAGAALLLFLAGRIWLSPLPALLGLLAAYTLWGWRRLAVIGSFLVSQTSALRAEPGLLSDGQTAKGDALNAEASQLHGLIDQLRRLRAFAADIVRFQPDALMVVEADGRVSLGNDAARRLFGKEVEAAAFDLILHELGSVTVREGRSTVETKNRTLMISEARIAEDRRIVRLADVTAVQQAAAEREETLQFLSHDLRAPSAGILTLLDKHALSGGGEPSAALLERVRAYARHGLTLADDFVRLGRSRGRPLDKRPVDMRDVAREALDMVWAKAIDRSVSTRDVMPDDRELWVMGDRAMLVRAALNLLDNAVKFAPKGAEIQYGVHLVDRDVCLFVSGPSPEMPPARAANPFALFADGRDTDSDASVGLGLALVEATAARHAGRAIYRYKPGYGATFTLCIPVAPTEEAEPARP